MAMTLAPCKCYILYIIAEGSWKYKIYYNIWIILYYTHINKYKLIGTVVCNI